MASTSRLFSVLAVSGLTFVLTLALTLDFTACGINVKEGKNGGDKEVTINSPVGDMHVGKDVQASDTGLSVYPGAKLVEKDDDHGSDRANVNISTSLFGLKVVVVKFVSEDSADKLVTFYENDLKRYGHVLTCNRSGGSDVNVDIHKDKGAKNSKELSCSGNGKGDTVELKVGTDSNFHIAAITPKGKGAEFALVYVRTHSEDDSTI